MPSLTQAEVARLRADTPGVSQVMHFNNAGASLMPRPVIAAMQDYLAFEAITGGYEAVAARSQDIDDFYHVCARLINATPRNIAFTASATDAFGRALSSVPLQPGDVIVTTDNDYISNQLAFLSFQRRFGVRLLRAEELPEGGVDPDSVRSLIREHRPQLVSVSHVPTNSGLIQDVEAVGRICREHEVLYLVDACQSVGQMPVDVQAIGCDFLSATFRKFLRGPRGAGFLYVSDHVLDVGLEPLLIDMRGARWSGRDAYTPSERAHRFEEWEQNYALMMGSRAACCYALDVGLAAIQMRTWTLADILRDGLKQLHGVEVLDRGREQCAIVTAYFRGRTQDQLTAQLSGINVGFSLAEYAVIDFAQKQVPWALRVAPHYYNTEEEVRILLDRLKEV